MSVSNPTPPGDPVGLGVGLVYLASSGVSGGGGSRGQPCLDGGFQAILLLVLSIASWNFWVIGHFADFLPVKLRVDLFKV